MSQKTNRLEEKVELIRSVVTLTLEELSDVENKITNLQARRSALKRDLTDLKEGRLDRIEERHTIDQLSKVLSVFTVQKKVVIGSKETNQWYFPFIVSIRRQDGSYTQDPELDINNSMTKINASGGYKLKSGEIRYL
jgi:hypothetical protein